MRISYKGDYAIKALIYLACKYLKEPLKYCQLTEIAHDQDIPEKFLEQILLLLRKLGFLKSQRGMRGGFALARAPEEISLGQVIRLIEGPLAPIACVAEDSCQPCDYDERCVLRPLWLEIREKIKDLVDPLDFKTLAQRQLELEEKRKQAVMYYI